jgi:hypothetical protein
VHFTWTWIPVLLIGHLFPQPLKCFGSCWHNV